MPYVIAQPCVDVKDRACVDECPVDCIYEGSRSLYINPNECVDCGACEPVCPTEAIFYEEMICLRNGHGIRMQQRASLLKLVTLEVLQLLVRLAKIQNRLLRCLRKISELVCEPADCA